MKIVARPRNTGKTSELVQYCIENKYTLLVHSYNYALRLKALYPNLNVESWGQYTNVKDHYLRLTHKDFVIDNLDILIYQLFGKEFRGFSITQEPTEAFKETIRSLNSINDATIKNRKKKYAKSRNKNRKK